MTAQGEQMAFPVRPDNSPSPGWLDGARFVARTAAERLGGPLALAAIHAQTLAQDPGLPPEARLRAQELMREVRAAAAALKSLQILERPAPARVPLPEQAQPPAPTPARVEAAEQPAALTGTQPALGGLLGRLAARGGLPAPQDSGNSRLLD